jgi:folate-binding protein YgfZ
MDHASALFCALRVRPTGTIERAGLRLPLHFGDLAGEYRQAVTGLVVHHRPYRGLLEITGADRHAWLHNLTTNDVKNLLPCDGNYAFVLDAKGRILFDANILVFRDAIQVDIDLRYLPSALQHFHHYLIMEDVKIADRTGDFDRWSLIGPKLGGLTGPLGVANLMTISQLQHGSALLAGPVTVMRHDFVGIPAVEVFVPRDSAAAHLEKLIDICREGQVFPIGLKALDTLRIEAGIPALGQDIDNTVLPAETLQVERAVSFQKGCYLGQEIVERMRSRGSLARRLIGVVFAGDRPPPVPADLHVGDALTGKLTSACDSPALGKPIGLGYLKTPYADPDTAVTARVGDQEFPGRVHPLPLTALCPPR